MSAFRFAQNKYRATRTADGFSSKLEKAVYVKLRDREVLGLIADIRRQQVVVLQPGDKLTRINWKVDFSFMNVETCEREYAEAKGFETNDYILKLKLWRANPPYALEIWKGNYRYPKMVERIEKKAEASA